LPLANNLFDERPAFRTALTTYRDIQPIVPYLRSRGNKGLEEVLQELYDNEANHPDRPRQMMALRFYIRDLIHECSTHWLEEVDGITTHKTLLDQIRGSQKDRTLFATFNYDELLEDALTDHGFKIVDLNDYIRPDNQFGVYKLHGSMRWARLVAGPSDQPIRRQDLIVKAAKLNLIEPNYGLGIFENIQENEVENFPAVPAIAIPINSKSAFECPDNHLENLVQHLPKVDKILAIGWQGKEAHFMSLLKRHLPILKALCVVSVDDADNILRNLTSELADKMSPELSSQAYKYGFSNFVTQRAGMALFDL